MSKDDDDFDFETAIAPPRNEAQTRNVDELARVIVVEGPDAGRTFELDPNFPGRILIGTSPACAIQLTDATVSRRHASLERSTKGAYRLSDLESTNGTVVDGVRIGEAFVRGGEIVRVGSTAVRLEADDNAMAGGLSPPSQRLTRAASFGRMIGASPRMRRLYPLCERLAKAKVPVIIEGETGTGKEVLAESIHDASGLKGPFVVFDCTTVSPNLVEAELFGHERGAFTGAERARPGVFEEAEGGTLLIDEIGDLDLPLQAKLLRVLDRGELRRVGSTKTLRVDVRVLAATRRDLDKEVAANRFRDDLFHRLAVARIELPPLREREGDVPLLLRQFVLEMEGPPSIAAQIGDRYANHHWPGNVRELRNLVARFVALGLPNEPHPIVATTSRADASSTASSTPTSPPPPPPARTSEGDWLEELLAQPISFPIARRRALAEFERRYVATVLARHGGNIMQSAKASGLAQRYFRIVRARQK